MADWSPIDNVIGIQPIANTETTAAHPVGYRVRAKHATYGSGEFIYLSGAASTIVGSFATINMDDGSTTLLAANAIGSVGVSMSANNTTTNYGWYQIYGKAIGAAATTVTDNANVYATGTAGMVAAAVVDGDMVHMCKSASTTTTGTAEFEIHYPYTDDITTND